MFERVLRLLLLGAILVLTAFAGASPGYAQATRTWVSGVGDDANPCSRTAPCKTFAGAISKTAGFGEINCLDPGGFGAVTITKSITLLCDEGTGGLLAAGTNGIIVNVQPTDRVVVDGLDIEGANTGLNGIRMIGGGFLIVRNCSIRNFTQNAVDLAGTNSSPAPRVLIDHSLLTHNHGGFQVHPGSGVNNGQVVDSLIDTNTSFGLESDQGGIIILSASTVTGQPSSIVIGGNGQAISYGNNVLRNTGSPTSTLPLQ